MLKFETQFSPNCKPHQIILVPDEAFERVDDRVVKLTLNPSSFSGDFVISPHRSENTNNTDLLRLRLYCRDRNLKLISYGSLNQLPFLSIFSDEVWLENNSKLEMIYRTGSKCDTFNGIIGDLNKYFKKVKNVETFSKNWWDLKIHDIKRERIVDEFASMRIYIRQSSYSLFNKLLEDGTIPKNHLWLEVKFATNFSYNFLKNGCAFNSPMVGLNKLFQRKLLKVTKNHYMTIQLLSSLIRSNFFVCQAGSANLFSVVPVVSIMLHEWWLYDLALCRKMAIKRYGPIGKIIPFLSHYPGTLLNKDQIKFFDIAMKKIKPRYEIIRFKELEEWRNHL